MAHAFYRLLFNSKQTTTHASISHTQSSSNGNNNKKEQQYQNPTNRYTPFKKTQTSQQPNKGTSFFSLKDKTFHVI